MKKIEAIIKSFKLEEVVEALTEAGASGITVTDVKVHDKCHGCRCGPHHNEHTEPIPRHKIEVIVPDDDLGRFVSILQESARTDCIKNGDGNILISHVEEAIRIRTEEKGNSAVS